MTYAVLGEQELDVVGYWSALTASEKLSLAEQKMIEGKPALQYVGTELDTLKIEVNWHIAYCDPQAELDQMREVMASKQAYPLVMGNGLFRGRYVVRGIDIQVQRTDDMGTLHQIQASLDLVEYAAPPQPVAVANPPAVASSRHPAAQKPAAGPAPARTETVTNADGYSSTRIVRGPGMLGGGV